MKSSRGASKQRSRGSRATRGKKGEGPPLRTRLWIALGISCVIWAVLMTGFAAMVFHDSHKRVTQQKAEFDRTEEILQGQIQTYTNEKIALQRDLLSGKIIHEELGVLFQQLLYEQHRPRSGSELLTSYDRLFYQVSGKTLTREQRAEIVATSNRLWGDGTKAKQPEPAKSARGTGETVASPDTENPNAGRSPGAARPSTMPTVPLAEKPKGQPYSNREYGYAALFPEGWTVRSEVAASSVMASSPRKDLRDRFVANVLFTSTKLKEPIDLLGFEESQEGSSRVWTAFEVIKKGDLTISGKPARFVESRFERGGVTFKGITIFVVRPQFAYEMSFSSTESTYSKFQQTFSDIYTSVKFL